MLVVFALESIFLFLRAFLYVRSQEETSVGVLGSRIRDSKHKLIQCTGLHHSDEVYNPLSRLDPATLSVSGDHKLTGRNWLRY